MEVETKKEMMRCKALKIDDRINMSTISRSGFHPWFGTVLHTFFFTSVFGVFS